MQDRLASLDDPTAIGLLFALALPRLRHDSVQTELTPDLREALSTTYGAASAAPSEGELARQTLLFLALDPSMQPVLTAFLDGPQAEQLGKPAAKTAAGGKTISVAVAVLLALQTHVHIERDDAGKWSFVVDKPTTSEAILKPIVQRLLGLPPEPARLPRP
jgi:hypothetical protein